MKKFILPCLVTSGCLAGLYLLAMARVAGGSYEFTGDIKLGVLTLQLDDLRKADSIDFSAIQP